MSIVNCFIECLLQISLGYSKGIQTHQCMISECSDIILFLRLNQISLHPLQLSQAIHYDTILTGFIVNVNSYFTIVSGIYILYKEKKVLIIFTLTIDIRSHID